MTYSITMYLGIKLILILFSVLIHVSQYYFSIKSHLNNLLYFGVFLYKERAFKILNSNNHNKICHFLFLTHKQGHWNFIFLFMRESVTMGKKTQN